MYWLWLFLAIVLEVAATVCLKLSSGFSRIVPTAIMAFCYGSSFFLMTVALRRLDVATAYAVWSAVGTALMTMIGAVVFKEAFGPMKLSAIALIIVGVVFLNVASRQTPSSVNGATAQGSARQPVASRTASLQIPASQLAVQTPAAEPEPRLEVVENQ